jgi:hypothetical protein
VNPDAPATEDLFELGADLVVLDRHQAVHELDDRDLRTEALENAREFDPDRAGAEHEQVTRHLLEFEQLVARQHAAAVDRDVRQAARCGARGEHDVFRLEAGDLSLVVRDRHRAGTGDAAVPGERLHLVLLEQERHAARVLLDDLVLALVDAGHVDRDLALDGDAELGGLVGAVDGLRRLQQGLRGDATAQEAGAAEAGVLLDDGDAQAELSGPDGRDVPAGAGADDDDVEGGGGGSGRGDGRGHARGSC